MTIKLYKCFFLGGGGGEGQAGWGTQVQPGACTSAQLHRSLYMLGPCSVSLLP